MMVLLMPADYFLLMPAAEVTPIAAIAMLPPRRHFSALIFRHGVSPRAPALFFLPAALYLLP